MKNRCGVCGRKMIEVGYDSPGESDGYLCLPCCERLREDRRKTMMGVLSLFLDKEVEVHRGLGGGKQETTRGKLVLGRKNQPYTFASYGLPTKYIHFHWNQVLSLEAYGLFGDCGDPGHLGVERNIFLRESADE